MMASTGMGGIRDVVNRLEGSWCNKAVKGLKRASFFYALFLFYPVAPPYFLLQRAPL